MKGKNVVRNKNLKGNNQTMLRTNTKKGKKMQQQNNCKLVKVNIVTI